MGAKFALRNGFSVLIMFLAVSPAFGQAVATVQISGTVQDSSGAVIPEARVTATQTQTGFSRSATSGTSGNYVIPQLPVGSYQLSVEKAGFKGFVQKGIELQVGDNPRIDVALEVGAIEQQIEVHASAQMVQTEQTSVSSVIDQRRIVQLPLNGRQATQLIILAGAATASRNGGLATSKNYPSSVSISVAGGMGNGTNYLMDGADNEDAFSNVNQPFPFPDALQEFSVQTSTLSTRYGLHPGATVNVVTKSGTNQYHGALFEFVRNGALNARNFFASTHDSLKRNQFGGTIGGPIVNGKLFFFAGYQATRNRQNPPESLAIVPTAAMLAGDFSAAESAQCQTAGARTLIDPNTGLAFSPTNQIDPLRFSAPAVALATQYLPTTTDPCGRIRFGVPTTGDEDQIIGRIDWTKNDKHTIFGRYFIADYRNPAVFDGKNLLPTTRAGVVDRSQNFVLGDTYTLSPSTVNSLHLRFSRTRIDRGAAPNLINPTDLGVNINSLVPNFIDISLSGNFRLGCGVCAPGFFNDNSYQVADDVDYVRGNHQFAFGGAYFKNQLNWLANTLSNGQFVFNGQFTGDSLVDFLLGRLSSVGRGGPLAVALRQNVIGLYAQDTWQARPNLTVNFGVRWEPLLPEYDKNGIGVHFDHGSFTAGQNSTVYDNAPPGFFYYGDAGIPKSFTNKQMGNFAPRLGLAWHPRSNSNTVVRASYGIFYHQPMLYFIERFSQMSPYGDLVTLLDPTGGFADPLQQLGGDFFPLPYPPQKDAFFVDSGSFISMPLNVHEMYVQQWNLVVQRQIGPNWLVSASYIGNKSTHIWDQTEANPATYIPGSSTVGNTNQRRRLFLENPAANAGALVGSIALLDDGANANYNGLIVSVNHRFNQRFSAMANWTWSHCLGEGENQNDLAFPQYQNPDNRAPEYGNCLFDHRHIFNTSFLYSTPSDWGNPWAGKILRNWELSTIVSMYSGDWLTANSGRDNSRTGVGNDRPDVSGPSRLSSRTINQFFDTSVFTQNALGTFGNAGRSTVLGPAFVNFDLGVSRRLKIRERSNVEIRSEFFNVFNHTNFNDPSTTLTSSNFGRLTSSADPRILQFSLKVHF
jgi:Carboxypeptidase regulatory-like domain/TonB dependent receptor-like, beta-barrel